MAILSIFLSHFYNRFSDTAQADFIASGRGIDRRAKRFASSWASHLERTRDYIVEALADGGGEVVVLGSGRLRDLPIEALVERYDRVILVDGDPRIAKWSRRTLSRFGARITFELAEITGVFADWTKGLFEIGDLSLENAAALLRGFQQSKRCWSSDTVVSLNVMSQIGVMWRDRAYKILGAKLLDQDVTQELGLAIKRLEQAHVESFSSAKRAVLIADRFFITTRPQERVWEFEDALYSQWPEFVPDKETWLPRSWLWELVPVGGEFPGEGIIHEVWARAYR